MVKSASEMQVCGMSCFDCVGRIFISGSLLKDDEPDDGEDGGEHDKTENNQNDDGGGPVGDPEEGELGAATVGGNR